MKKSSWIELCSALLVLLFVYASLSKYIDFSQFKNDMHNQPFPLWFSNLLIWTLPPVELLIATLLMTRKFKKSGFWCSLLLMSLFTLYTGAVKLHLFAKVPCSCGGVIKHLSWTQHLLLNTFYLFVAGLAIILTKKIKKNEHIGAYA